MVRPAVGTGEQKWGIAGIISIILHGFIRLYKAQPGGKCRSRPSKPNPKL